MKNNIDMLKEIEVNFSNCKKMDLGHTGINVETMMYFQKININIQKQILPCQWEMGDNVHLDNIEIILREKNRLTKRVLEGVYIHQKLDKVPNKTNEDGIVGITITDVLKNN